MVYGQQQNWWRKKLNNLLNRHFKMLKKSFPVAPTATTPTNTKTTAVGAQN
jgi:hypothetical protein